MDTTILKNHSKKAGKLILSAILFVILIPFYVWVVLALVNHIADFTISIGLYFIFIFPFIGLYSLGAHIFEMIVKKYYPEKYRKWFIYS